MKRTMVQFLSITLMFMLLTGCGRAAGTDGTAAGTSGVRPKDPVTAETGTLAETNASHAETETSTAHATENVKETTAHSSSEAAKETTAQSTKKSGATQTETQATGDIISEEEARKIALKDAGLEEKDVSNIRVKLEKEDGVQEYEVDFYAGNKEYDYDIDAKTGKIRSKDMDIEDDFKTSGSSTDSVKLSKEEAKKLVLKKVPKASENDIRIHLDYDDGMAVYEGSLVHDGIEYDFEIDANTGSILEWEQERAD